jgi:RNA polymerase sigma-70 factor (ECF subfamily)
MAGLKRLKELDRDTLVAFYIRGHSLKRIARDFETPVGTVKRRLHVARNRLRQVLERGRTTGERRKRRKRTKRDDRELACV